MFRGQRGQRPVARETSSTMRSVLHRSHRVFIFSRFSTTAQPAPATAAQAAVPPAESTKSFPQTLSVQLPAALSALIEKQRERGWTQQEVALLAERQRSGASTSTSGQPAAFRRQAAETQAQFNNSAPQATGKLLRVDPATYAWLLACRQATTRAQAVAGLADVPAVALRPLAQLSAASVDKSAQLGEGGQQNVQGDVPLRLPLNLIPRQPRMRRSYRQAQARLESRVGSALQSDVSGAALEPIRVQMPGPWGQYVQVVPALGHLGSQPRYYSTYPDPPQAPSPTPTSATGTQTAGEPTHRAAHRFKLPSHCRSVTAALTPSSSPQVAQATHTAAIAYLWIWSG